MARSITGVVTSDVQDKTIVVTVTTAKRHPIYGKAFKRSRKFAAHDENNAAHIGDTVTIENSRPISKTKAWRLSKIVQRGHEIIEVKQEAVELEAEAKKADAKILKQVQDDKADKTQDGKVETSEKSDSAKAGQK
jgi:small subunit ribosomal protein S17